MQYKVLSYERVAMTRSRIKSKTAFSPPERFLKWNPSLEPLVNRNVPSRSGCARLFRIRSGKSDFRGVAYWLDYGLGELIGHHGFSIEDVKYPRC